MIVADWCKSHPKIDHLGSLALVPNIEVKLSTIPESSNGFVPFARVTHAKFMTVDEDQCWVGCSNWQRGYYYSSRDVGVIIKNEYFSQFLRDIFLKDWDSNYVYFVQPGADYQPPKVSP